MNDRYVQVSESVIAQRYFIIGTTTTPKYRVWKKIDSGQTRNYASLWYNSPFGLIAEYDSERPVCDLPYGSKERSAVVRSHYARLHEEAQAIIRTAFAEDFQGE